MQWSTASFVIGMIAGGVIGGVLGFAVYALICMAHKSGRQADYLKDMADAYNDGVRAGKSNAMLRRNVFKMDQGIED